MREIKFRGYDKEFEKMTYFDDEEYDYRPPLAFRLDQVFKKDSNYDNYEDFEYSDITEKIEIMQYTGLCDKNGKEIYEGDIVKYKVKGSNLVSKTVIEYNEEHGAFLFGIYKGSKMPCGKKTRMNKHTRKSVNDVEVIGNIYENKELLEE